MITGVKIKHSTAFGGGATASATVRVKDANTNYYGLATDVFIAPGATVGRFAQNFEFASIPNHTLASNISLELIIGGDIIDNLTTGTVDVWIKTEIVV